MFTKFINSPYLSLIAGVALLVASGYEVWESFEEFSLGAHHGLFVYALVQVAKVLPEIIKGFKEIQESQVLSSEK